MNRILRSLLMAALAMIIATLYTPAQDSASSTALSPESVQRLIGEIKWKKELGVPPGSSADDICKSFYVLAFVEHPMPRALPLASDLKLERPKADDPTYYSCRFELKAPYGTKLLVFPHMGNASRYWEPTTIYRSQWIGGPTPPTELKWVRQIK